MGTGFLAFFAFGAVGDGVSGFFRMPLGTEFPAFFRTISKVPVLDSSRTSVRGGCLLD